MATSTTKGTKGTTKVPAPVKGTFRVGAGTVTPCDAKGKATGGAKVTFQVRRVEVISPGTKQGGAIVRTSDGQHWRATWAALASAKHVGQWKQGQHSPEAIAKAIAQATKGNGAKAKSAKAIAKAATPAKPKAKRTPAKPKATKASTPAKA